MARNIPAFLAIASLCAPCCLCSGDAQGLEDNLDVEEITAEAEVGLLQVKVNQVPRLPAASSDALWSTSGSPPSAPVLIACLAMGLAAAGLSSIVLLREIYLHWRPSTAAGTISVRFMHVVVVSTTALIAAKYSCIIPLVLDLADEVDWGPAKSSMFLGGFGMGRFVGSVLAWVFQPRVDHNLARQVAIASVLLITVMEVLVCVPLLLQPASSRNNYFIFGMRLLSGLLGGIAVAMVNVIVRKYTSEEEHTPLSLSIGIAVSIGMFIGPLKSTLVLTCLGRQRHTMEVSDKVAALILFEAIITACISIMFSFSIPTSIEEVSCGAEGDTGTEAVGDENCEAKDVATSRSSIQKEAFILAAAIVSLLACGLSIVSIEEATSMLLEVQFDWSTKQIGIATAAALGPPTVLLALTCMLLTETEVVRTSTLKGLFLMQAMVGVVFLYESKAIHFGGLQLFCSDFLLYPPISVLSFYINGEVFTIATKGSALISPESAQLVTSTTAGLDIISVVSARWLLTVRDRNGYATSQAVLVGLLFLAYYSSPSEGGSEATTADATKAVPAGSESAPKASPDGTSTGTAAARLLEGDAK